MHHYNFPPLLGRGDGLHARPQAPRHRARCARPAGARADDPAGRRVPAIRIVSETLESNGSSSMKPGMRIDARADGRRGADQGSGGRHRHGPREGGRRLRHSHGHPGRGRSPRRHGFQGRRHPRGDHRAPDGHQDHRRHAGDHASRPRPGQARPRVHPRPHGRDHLESREELAAHAPRITTVKIDPEQIGLVIGKGGETIRALEADHEVQVDIEEDGTILIYATEGTQAEAAIAAIQALTKEPEVGTPTRARS